MAAACVLGVTGTLLVTSETVVTLGTQANLAQLPRVPWLAQTSPADVVALGAVHAAARLAAAYAVFANRALVLAPFSSVARAAETLSGGRHTLAPVVTLAFLGTVPSKTTLLTRLTAHCTHPSGWAGALSSHVVAHPTILAGASLLTLLPMLAWRAQVLTESTRVSW